MPHTHTLARFRPSYVGHILSINQPTFKLTAKVCACCLPRGNLIPEQLRNCQMLGRQGQKMKMAIKINDLD